MDNLPSPSPLQAGNIPVPVNDDHIRIGVCEDNVRHFLFFAVKDLPAPRYAEDKGVAIEQVAAVSDNHILLITFCP